MSYRRVIIESPYRGRNQEDLKANIEYAKLCMRDALSRGEAPFVSHLLYASTNVLDDNNPDERKMWIEAGLAWYPVVEASIVYTDRGISEGMKQGIERAKKNNVPVEYRFLS